MKKSKALIIASLAAVIVISSSTMIWENAWGHGVQAQLQSRFIEIKNEAFSGQTVETGEEIVVTGDLVSRVNRDTRAWISIFSESTNAGNRWEFVARDPPGNVFDIPAQGTVPYKITVKALEPGVYHLHTQLNVANIGPGLGPGQPVQVTGEPIVKPVSTANVIYQSIIIAVGLGVSLATKPWQVI